MDSDLSPAPMDLDLTVAGLGLRLRAAPALLERLRSRYRGFQASAAECLLVQTHLVPSGAHTAWSEPLATFVEGALTLKAPGYEGRIDLRTGQAWLTMAPAQAAEGLDYFLRAACALQVFEKGGLLLHAAGLLREGMAYLFFGPSGSGKSTLARHSPGASLLNDDLVVLLPQEGGWMAYATPFSRTSPPPSPGADRGPLQALFSLVQDQQVYAEPLSRGQALAQLLASVPLLPLAPTRGEALLARLDALLDAVPVQALHFTPDPSLWEAVDATIAPQTGPLPESHL